VLSPHRAIVEHTSFVRWGVLYILLVNKRIATKEYSKNLYNDNKLMYTAPKCHDNE